MFNGLRIRLTLYYAGIFGLVLVTLGLAMFGFVRHVLYQGVDEGARIAAAGVRQSIEVDGGRIRVPSDFFDEDERALYQGIVTLQLTDVSGRPQLSRGLALQLPRPDARTDRTVQFHGVPMRLHTEALRDDGRLVGYVRIVRPLGEVQAVLRRLAWALGGCVLVALAVTLVVGVMLAGIAVQPVLAAFTRLQRFTADASHELRTPLTIIQTQAELLANAPTLSSPERQSMVEPILRASRRMAGLVSDLLFLARSDATRPEVLGCAIALDELVEETVEEFRGWAKTKGLLLNFTGEPTPVWGDPERLHQLVANLVGNAIKYTERGEILVEVRPDHAQAVLTLRDSGIGIEPGHLPHVFERFYRADAARSSSQPGTGLGLAIAQAIVSAHRGDIRIRSNVGMGTTVTVVLPLRHG